MIYTIYIMDIRSTDLNLLVVFEAVWLERNVTRAAKRLGLTQSATSSALQRLREATGDQLLIRSLDGMVPTPKAEALSEPISQALKMMRLAFSQQPKFDPATSRLTFTLIATDFVQAVLLPSLRKSLAKSASGIDLIVKPPTGDIPIRALEKGDVDLVFAPFESTHAGIYRRTLFKETYVCVARKNHSSIKKSLSIHQFCAAEHVLISFKGDRHSIVDDMLAKQSLQRRVALVVPYFHMGLEMVAQSDLIMTCPSRLVRESAELQVFEVPLSIPGFSIYEYWHERTHASDAHIWLRQQLSDIVNRQEPP